MFLLLGWPGLTKHMSMVGIDYFGSDVGGFERKFLEEDEDAK
jgi:alpha-glucosidase (family GH31 glycosyl hydrolase)